MSSGDEMSQISQTTASNLTDGYPVTSLTLVVLLLIPCVVILLLLNCLFLGYKLLILSKKKKNGSRQTRENTTEEMLLQSTLALQRVGRVSDVPFPLLQDGRRAYMSLSEPALPHHHQPVTSSRASSWERDHRIRLLRPDGATGSGSPRAPPSSIRATSSAAGSYREIHPPSGSRTYKVGWCKSAPVLLPHSSDSEAETCRVNLVPPNSPTQEPEHVGHVRRSSTYEWLTDVNPDVAVHMFDKVEMECEYTSRPSETSRLNTSAVGPGLDSDFGASAGVSLRILSADSDGLSNGVLASNLEWDYYDPCYVRQNYVHKHKHHRPVMHAKQYWV